MNNDDYTAPLSKKENDDEDPLSGDSGPEYSFEGYSIEFNDKIVLTPVQEPKKK